MLPNLKRVLVSISRNCFNMNFEVLSSSDINSILSEYDIYSGTFASDKFKLSKKVNNQAFVINTADSTSPGDHWIALIKSEAECFFFDSFGLPIYTQPILQILKQQNILCYQYNSIQIQPKVSNNCGYYCIAFILSYINRFSYDKFLNYFFYDVSKNDKICYDFIRKYIS